MEVGPDLTNTVVYDIQYNMRQNIQIDTIPDIISVTDLRYKTSLLLQKLLDEEKPLLLVKRNKKIAVIYPLSSNSGEKRPQFALKIKAFPMGAKTKVSRKVLYDEYLAKKLQ